MTAFPRSLVLCGAGKMGGAMLAGWLRQGLPGQAVTIIDPHPSDALRELCRAQSIALNPEGQALQEPEVLLLAIKPQTLAAAGPMLGRLAGPATLVISIMAGKTVANMRAQMPRASAFIRAMPNTPAAVGRGITGCYPTPEVGVAGRELANALLQAIGRVEWVEEEGLIDAVTAVSGSGPAYVFHLAECMAAAGVAAGLEPALAARLARATVEGAGELMYREAETGPDTLRKNVTSPGGTTAAALEVLMADDGLQPLMTRAVAAARRRAGELSG